MLTPIVHNTNTVHVVIAGQEGPQSGHELLPLSLPLIGVQPRVSDHLHLVQGVEAAWVLTHKVKHLAWNRSQQ